MRSDHRKEADSSGGGHGNLTEESDSREGGSVSGWCERWSRSAYSVVATMHNSNDPFHAGAAGFSL